MNGLPDWVKPGAVYKAHGRKYHVRGIVDGMAVVREWWSSKQRWNYTVEDDIFFEVMGARLVVEKKGAHALKLLTAGRLAHGDYVRLNENGFLVKAEPSLPGHLGVLPRQTVFHDGYVEIPDLWLREADEATRQNVKQKVF